MKYNSIDVIVPIGGNKPADQVIRCLKSVKHAVNRCNNQKSQYYDVKYIANCICVFTDAKEYKRRDYSKVRKEIKDNEFTLILNDQDYSKFNSASIGRYLGVQASQSDALFYVDCDDMVSNDICIYTLDMMNTFNCDLIQTAIIEHPELSIRYPTKLHKSSKWNLYSFFNRYDDSIDMMAMYQMSREVAINAWNDIISINEDIFDMNYGEDVIEQLSLLKNAKRARSTHHITYMYFLYQGVCNDMSMDTKAKKKKSVEEGARIISELTNEVDANKFRIIYNSYLRDTE